MMGTETLTPQRKEMTNFFHRGNGDPSTYGRQMYTPNTNHTFIPGQHIDVILIYCLWTLLATSLRCGFKRGTWECPGQQDQSSGGLKLQI